MFSDFWLVFFNGSHQQDIEQWEENEVGIFILFFPYLPSCTVAFLYAVHCLCRCYVTLFTGLYGNFKLGEWTNADTPAVPIAVSNKLSLVSDPEFCVFCQHPWNYRISFQLASQSSKILDPSQFLTQWSSVVSPFICILFCLNLYTSL